MTECGKKLKLYNVEVKDKNFYFKDPVKLPKNTKLGNDISNKTKDIPATTFEECQGKGVGKGASSIEIKNGKCVFYDDNTNTKNSCGDKCYQLEIKNISDYRTENGEEIKDGMDNGDIKIYKKSEYDDLCKQTIYNFDTKIQNEDTNTYKCDNTSKIYNSKKDAEDMCLKNDKCTGIYNISCDSSRFKLCIGKLDSSCADQKNIGGEVYVPKESKLMTLSCSNDNIPSICNFSIFRPEKEINFSKGIFKGPVKDRCPEACGVEKCKKNILKYDSDGCVYKKTPIDPEDCHRLGSILNYDTKKCEWCDIGLLLDKKTNKCTVDKEDCHRLGKILNYDTKKCEGCDIGTFLDKTTNKCVTKGVSNKNIIMKPIPTILLKTKSTKGMTNKKLKQLLLLNGPIYVSLRLDDPESKKNINARACPHKIFDIQLEEGQVNNHGTVLVGYGQVKNDKEKNINYWVIANSWGGKYRNWGNHGFFAVRMTDNLSSLFPWISYLECEKNGSFVDPGLVINETNLKNAKEHNLSKKIIEDLYFEDVECRGFDNKRYATGNKKSTDADLENFYSSVTGDKINVDTFEKIPVRYKHNFSWADPQKNPFKESFVSTINDQMNCGSCWAFASSYLLQSLISIQYYLKYKKPRNIHLSVKSVIENRSKPYSDSQKYFHTPCSGGSASVYFSLLNIYGVVPEEDCKYTEGLNDCDDISGEWCTDDKCITENFTEKSKITSCPADDNNNYIVYLIIGIVVVVLIVIFIFWFRKKKK